MYGFFGGVYSQASVWVGLGGERRGSFSLSQSFSWEGSWGRQQATWNIALWLGGKIAFPALSDAALSDSSAQMVRT